MGTFLSGANHGAEHFFSPFRPRMMIKDSGRKKLFFLLFPFTTFWWNDPFPLEKVVEPFLSLSAEWSAGKR